MKTLQIMSAIVGFVLISMTSCYYDVEEELYPTTNNTCDTTNISFATDVTAILQSNCLFCHNKSANLSLGGGVDLEGYDALKVYVDNGKFLSSITHDGNASFMPKGGGNPKLPDCEIAQITAWINNGAPNN
ncbi:MAG: hypothetical protein JJ975_12405 [Bacteroidia bacterium]|nr:hypothetical protein [Bacteroidia bacterium]